MQKLVHVRNNYIFSMEMFLNENKMYFTVLGIEKMMSKQVVMLLKFRDITTKVSHYSS